MAASSGARRPAAFVEDTAVAPERLGEYVARFREILDRHDLTAGFYGHCSVGCLHIRPFVDLTEPGGVETMQEVADEIAQLVASFDGVNSSEHGDGRVRSPFNRRVFGDDLYEAMRRVKHLFDPDGRMNPGIMVDAAPLNEGLRDPALPPAGPLRTRLSFAEHGGMRGAADRCQRIGACRKTGSGRDVPVLHGHARGGACHPRPRQRARQGAVLTRPAGRAGRRAPARDPRPLPGVQGVQERVPAQRRHGRAEGRVPLALPGLSTACRRARACSARSAASTGSAPPRRRCPTCPPGCPARVR